MRPFPPIRLFVTLPVIRTAEPPPGVRLPPVLGSPALAPATPAVVRRAARVAVRLDLQQKLACVLWAIILTDPQFWLQDFGLSILLRAPLVLTVALVLTLVSKPGKGDLLWVMVAWIMAMAINLPFSYDRGTMMTPLRTMILFYVIGFAVVRGFRSPRAVAFALFMLCVGQYLWWGVMGIKDGMVPWHPNLSNFDGYGPMMACGVGPAYYYANATRIRWRRTLALIASGMCVIGVVSAFARGGVLALIATVIYIWIRSPNKARTTGLMVAGFLLVVAASALIDGQTRGDDTRSNFFDEMSTMFDHSAGSTGDDRIHLWTAAIKVFKAHPVFGVGPDQFGPAAVTLIAPGEIQGAAFSDNPATLYARALHSNYFEVLCEFGVVGSVIYLFMIGQFFQRSFYVVRHAARINLEAAGISDPRMIELGLEAGMVAYLVSGIFFNQLFTAWLYCLFFANALMYRFARPASARDRSMTFRSGST